MNDNTFDDQKDVNITIKGKHRCELHSPDKAYGVAVNYCYEDEDGKLWVGNIEYESQVSYCPVCGYKAKKIGI